MISVATVCNVYDDPAIPLTVDPSALLTGVRVKGLATGRLLTNADVGHPMSVDGKAYIGLPGFQIGELVAYCVEALSQDDLERWFADDHEVGLRDFVQERVVCLTTPEPADEPEGLQEPPREITHSHEEAEDVQEPEAQEKGIGSLQGGVTGCAVSELRTVLIEVMRRQDRAMTVREIAAILNSDTVDARTRIAANLADMEDKGLVKRGGYVPSSSPGRKTATTWVVA